MHHSERCAAILPFRQNPIGTVQHYPKTAFAFDLDGTITQAEILPEIAAELDLEPEIRLLTELTMAGLIPFEESFRLRFAILRHANIDRIHRAVSEIKIEPHIKEFINNNRDNCFIITGNLDIWVQPLTALLPCKFYASKAQLDAAGNIIGLNKVMRKNLACLELKRNFDRIITIGDGFNDIPMFDVADIGIAYSGVHSAPEALVSISNYVAQDGKSLCRLLNTL